MWQKVKFPFLRKFFKNDLSYYLDKERGEPFMVSKEQLRVAEEAAELEDYPEWGRTQIKLVRKILPDK